MSEFQSSGLVPVPTPWTPEGLRKSSDSADTLPWTSKLVALIRIEPAGRVTFAKQPDRKRDLLAAAAAEDLLLVAWPGQWSQDVFVVDDRAGAKAALATTSPRLEDRA